MKTPKIPKSPAPPPAPPPPPTVDQAARDSEEADKLRRRKGRLATIFAGMQGGATPTSQKSLTGQ